MIIESIVSSESFLYLTADKYETRTILITNKDKTKQLELVTQLDRIGKSISHYEVGKPDELHPFKSAFIQSAIEFYNVYIP